MIFNKALHRTMHLYMQYILYYCSSLPGFTLDINTLDFAYPADPQQIFAVSHCREQKLCL